MWRTCLCEKNAVGNAVWKMYKKKLIPSNTKWIDFLTCVVLIITGIREAYLIDVILIPIDQARILVNSIVESILHASFDHFIRK